MTGTGIGNAFDLNAPKPLFAGTGKFVGGRSIPWANKTEAFAGVAATDRSEIGQLIAIGDITTGWAYYQFERSGTYPTGGEDSAGWNLVQMATGGEVEETFTQTILFDAPQKFSSTTQTTDLNFTLAGSGNDPRSFYEVEIYPDGVHDITIDEDDFHVEGAIPSPADQVVNIQFYYPSIGTIKPSATVSLMPTYGTLAAFTSFGLTVVNDDIITADWTAIPFAAQYDVYYKKTADPTFALHGSTAGVTYDLDGLDDTTNYSVYVVATASGWNPSTSSTQTATTDAPSTLTYPQSVTASSPVYYNRMQANSSTQTPDIGTGNMTLTGGAVPFVSGAYTTSKAVQFDGNDDEGAVATIPIGAVTEIAIEMFFYQDQSPVPSDDGTILSLGANWAATPGGLGLSNTSGYNRFDLAYLGSNGLYERSVPKITTVGWNHLVFVFQQGQGLTKAIINGVVQTITSHATPGGTDTATFLTDMYVMCAGTVPSYNESGKIQDVAVYGTTIPSTADFQAHYANKDN